MCPDFWTTDDEFKNTQNDCGTSYLAKLRYQTRKGRVWAGEPAALGMGDSESHGAVGFVFLSNIVTSVLFVCLCYAQEIESVHEPFDVQVTVYDAGDLPYSVISSLIYALSFVFLGLRFPISCSRTQVREWLSSLSHTCASCCNCAYELVSCFLKE